MTADATILSCRRRGGFFSRTYELSLGPDVVGQLDFSGKNSERLTVHGSSYSTSREGRGRWLLERDEGTVAEALRIESAPLNVRIVFDDIEWFMTAEGRVSGTYKIREGTETIGCIEPKIGILSNRIELTVPRKGRLEICGFMVWLVGIHWSGMVGVARAAASGI